LTRFTPQDQPRILVVGDLMLDEYIEGSVDRISPEAPVPVLHKRRSRAVAGGAANVAANIAGMGGRPLLVGVVGDDAAARQLRGILAGHGVTDEGLVVDAERGTTTKTRVVVGQQQIVRVDSEISSHVPADLEDRILARATEALDNAAILLLSDYAKGVLTDRVISELIARARARDVFVVVDPKRADFSAYNGADLIKPNRSEFERAAGHSCRTDEDIDAGVRALASRFSGGFLITRAEQGMTLARPGLAPVHIRTTVREVADVSGAGDTGVAALSVALCEGQALEAAVAVANAASGIAVGKLGTAVVTRAELDAVLALGNSVFHAGACVDLATARAVVQTWRLAGEEVVFTNGCFDILHPGHIRILESAAREGTRLIVGVNTDASVSRLKGPTRPVQSEDNRTRVLGALRFVDMTILFDDDTPLELIRELRPDVLVKGADYTEDQVVGGDVVKAYGGRIALVPLVEGQSSSNLIRRAALGRGELAQGE
jgi:D-beta-D-heptose 7-phosphate kinase/D-beta-D-heptose 1-phosphate adenosyltransferase